MISSHQIIYETFDLPVEEVQELIGAGDPKSVALKRERMKTFLSEHEWDEEQYKVWLRTEALPSYTDQAKNLANDIKANAYTGFAVVDDDTHASRKAICEACDYYREDGRCSLCGCFMGAKSKLKGSACPVNKW